MASILFHNPRAVMVRVPKTGSTSIVRGLFGGIGPRDEVVAGPLPASWRSNFSFAFVRNPFSRIESALRMFQRYSRDDESGQLRQSLTLTRLLDVVEDPDIPLDQPTWLSRLRSHAIPMTHPHFGLELVQRIYRFEQFRESWRDLISRLGAECVAAPADVPHWRKSTVSMPWCWSDDDLQRAQAIYKDDCARFEYGFEGERETCPAASSPRRAA